MKLIGACDVMFITIFAGDCDVMFVTIIAGDQSSKGRLARRLEVFLCVFGAKMFMMLYAKMTGRRANRPGRLGLAKGRCYRVHEEDRGRGEAAMASILIGTMAVTLGIGAAETVRRVMSTPQVTRGRANTHTRKTSD